MSNTYYVYFLKDPRKSKFIQEIVDSGYSSIIAEIVDQLTGEQALQIENVLISSFGTIDTRGS